uniref:Anaphase-promoting complex subunit 11 n=1 Tax=Plectus sambesii TaxID=2011161 RepID=A0A914UUJ8_9BILA
MMKMEENVPPPPQLTPTLMSSSSSAIDIKPFQSKTRLKVRIKKWNAVANWKWVANDDSCGICRMAFDACCGECKTPGDDCPLVWGHCSHPFHMHCIVKWLESQSGVQQCPMCRQEWKFSQAK